MEGLVRVGRPEAGVGGCHGGRWDRGEESGQNGGGPTRARLSRALSLGWIWCADPILYRARPSLRPDPTRHPAPPETACLLRPPTPAAHAVPAGSIARFPALAQAPHASLAGASAAATRPPSDGPCRTHGVACTPLASTWRTRTAVCLASPATRPSGSEPGETPPARPSAPSQGPRPPAANKNAPKPCPPAPVAARHIRVQASHPDPSHLAVRACSLPTTPPRLNLGPLLSLLTSKCLRVLSHHRLHSDLPRNRRHMPAPPRPSVRACCHQIAAIYCAGGNSPRTKAR